jgi:glycosyltransferase involved in cell wall biosynthesis
MNQLLLVTPTLRARFEADGTLTTTRKFLDGMQKYVELWPGPIRLLMQQTPDSDANLDHTTVRIKDLPFDVVQADFADAQALRSQLAGAGVLLASLDHEQVSVASLCAEVSVPCVYVSEYSLRTRYQIIDTSTRNPLLRWRRRLWASRLEGRQRKAVKRASGIQCNGTPTFDAYQPINPSPHLYFDTRVSPNLIVSPELLRDRLARMMAGGPIRLAFSGRLAKMKGADHLVKIARALKAMGVEFRLDIFGNGECASDMKREIASNDLGDRVIMRGVLRFAEELMPEMSANVDLAILPHPQGDPSCTYLETLSAGVPIAGYANEAWTGVQRTAKAEIGVSTKLGDPEPLAAAIAELARDRARLARMSEAGRLFALGHTFDDTFKRRIDHLLSVRSAFSQTTPQV